jgi:hypothetical protein
MKKILSVATVLLAVSLMAPAVSAQSQYSLTIDTPASYFDFGGDSSVGRIRGTPGYFNMGGALDLNLNPAAGPFTTGEFISADMVTVPNVLYAKVNNVFSWLPPLAEIEIHDANFKLTSPQFNLDTSGTWSTDVIMWPLGGYIVTIPLVGSTTTVYLTDTGPTDPTPVSGNLSVSGSTVILDLPIDLVIAQDDGAGNWAVLDLAGTLYATAPVQADVLSLSVNALTAGNTGAFSATSGSANAPIWLAYGMSLGTTTIPQLGVDLGINNPTQAGNRATTDSNGDANWFLPIPGFAAGYTVYFQCCQVGEASNVVTSAIQ